MSGHDTDTANVIALRNQMQENAFLVFPFSCPPGLPSEGSTPNIVLCVQYAMSGTNMGVCCCQGTARAAVCWYEWKVLHPIIVLYASYEIPVLGRPYSDCSALLFYYAGPNHQQ
eukprot:2795898-Rhodomonas_salina.5